MAWRPGSELQQRPWFPQSQDPPASGTGLVSDIFRDGNKTFFFQICKEHII